MPNEFQNRQFDPASPKAALAELPQSPAVFALYGADSRAEPYIGRTPNLRSRLERLLQPSAKHPRRLHLAGLVRRIEWQLTGSDFESLLAQFSLLDEIFGAKVLERMHLRHPAFVRFLGSNPYPRVTVTHRPSLREADWAYGPFASRAAAERYAEEMLKLFLLRRCTFELAPDPSYPGCVYSEMKMCLAPCFKGCTDERYAEEASSVRSFLATRGESRLVTLRAERDQASADLAFESAPPRSTLKSSALRLCALSPPSWSAHSANFAPSFFKPQQIPMKSPSFSLTAAACAVRLLSPLLGMRIQNEQSGSTSLFAQPLAIEPIPEEQGTRDQGPRSTKTPPLEFLARFSSPASMPHSPHFCRAPPRPRPPFARAISRCSSAGTTGLKQSAPAKSFSPMRTATGR